MDAMEKEIVNKNKQEKGVTTVEYAVMLALVAVGVLTLDPDISGTVTGVFTSVVDLLGAAGN